MLDKLKRLFSSISNPYVRKLRKLKSKNIDLYKESINSKYFEFINSNISASIKDLKNLCGYTDLYKEIVEVRPINNMSIKRISFREWFTDEGYIISDPIAKLKEWINISITFIKLCDKLSNTEEKIAIKNYRKIKPYQNEIELIADFLLENV